MVQSVIKEVGIMSYLIAFATLAVFFLFASYLLPFILPLILLSMIFRLIFRPRVKVYTTTTHYSRSDPFFSDSSWYTDQLPTVEKRKPLEGSIDAEFIDTEE